MALEELMDLQSGLWQMLHIYQSPSGWTVRDLAAMCSRLADQELTTLYLVPEAEGRFRAFVREDPFYFRYDPERDRVFPSSYGAALEAWLVRYLALRVEESGGCLKVEGSAKKWPALPKAIAEHLLVIYNNCLPLFVKTHPDDFFIDEDNNRLWLTPALHQKSLAASVEEQSLNAFFIDLLHKIGATKDKPCNIHMLSMYVCFMTKEEKKLLRQRYHGNLNVFFLLNPVNFTTTKPSKGCVFLKNPDTCYGTAVFLRQQLQMQSKAGDEQPAKVALIELASSVKYSLSPVVQGVFSNEARAQQVKDIVLRNPTMFHFDEADAKVWLRKTYPAWKGDEWSTDTELLAVAYYIDLLRDIGATSRSSAISFTYISRTAGAAPVTCKDYLESVYPGLDIIDLFHLHPAIFDLSSVNKVSLKMTFLGAKLEAGAVPAKQRAMQFAGKLMKYIDRMDPGLLHLCMESAAPEVRDYCRATVKGRLKSVMNGARNVELKHTSSVAQGQKTLVFRRFNQKSSTSRGEQMKTSGKLVQARSELKGRSSEPKNADSKLTQPSTVLKETGHLTETDSELKGISIEPTQAGSGLKETSHDLTEANSERTKPSAELEEISNELAQPSAGLKEMNNKPMKTNSEPTQPRTEHKQSSDEVHAIRSTTSPVPVVKEEG
ncbi:hypothetical protein HPB48_002062 [Haemaphysalis longicornis]|uniref:Uncharacterized protein n=1 Tax=Haemaphysalis longicornis TaxID=44386 RepID=A0A9J6FJJ5_HAELO|nr:hypothetical protein HPB48_002062 [Haemaphysalis longicornis]